MSDETCFLPGCDKWVAIDLLSAPVRLCHGHASQVVERYRHVILAQAELEAMKRASRAAERSNEAQGNPGGRPLVYYAQIGNYIKIGYSTRLQNRLRSLRVDELLAIEPGGPELEKQRHHDFRADRIDLRRENFRGSDVLLRHILAMREKHGLPLWATRPRTSEIRTRKVAQ